MSLAIAEIDREPRVLDLELANRLGFSSPHKIRVTISRNKPELEQYGEVVFRSTPNTGRGRPGKECWLNEGQALLLCMFSQTTKAATVRKELIDVFMDWRQKTVAVRKHNRRPPARRALPPEPLVSFSIIGRGDIHDTYDFTACVPRDVAYDCSRVVMAYMMREEEQRVRQIEGVFQ